MSLKNVTVNVTQNYKKPVLSNNSQVQTLNFLKNNNGLRQKMQPVIFLLCW